MKFFVIYLIVCMSILLIVLLLNWIFHDRIVQAIKDVGELEGIRFDFDINEIPFGGIKRNVIFSLIPLFNVINLLVTVELVTVGAKIFTMKKEGKF